MKKETQDMINLLSAKNMSIRAFITIVMLISTIALGTYIMLNVDSMSPVATALAATIFSGATGGLVYGLKFYFKPTILESELRKKIEMEIKDD